MTKITIGARGSNLSIAYVKKVKELLIQKNKDLKEEDINFKAIQTSGDIHQSIKLSEIGGKNLFCKEIEEKLKNKEIDIAVHSLKDMESVEDSSLVIGAYLKRNDYRDVIISNTIKSLEDLKKKIVIGSSSRRRELQLKKINKNISVSNIRGNIDTRIKKLNDNFYDAIILSYAGVKSLYLDQKISQIFSTSEIIPSAGQGVIALQCRKKDEELIKLLKKINHESTYKCILAERNVLKVLDGDCETAVGVHAAVKKNEIVLEAELFSLDGSQRFDEKKSAKIEKAKELGIEIGEILKTKSNSIYKK